MREPAAAPKPIRNDVMQPAEEVLVLRDHALRLGSHRQYFEWSRSGIWPFFMRIGARVVGEWKEIYPDGSPAPIDREDGWRLARYAGMDHWHDTRGGLSLAGDGPLQDRHREGVRKRNAYLLRSDDVFFLTGGGMAPGGPYYLPGLEEDYELIGEEEQLPPNAPHPARLDVAQPGEELVAFRTYRIEKGSFDRFHALQREAVWPFLDKIGARPIGEWRRFYPDPPIADRAESGDFDEAVSLTRYASYEHWQATRQPAALGGDGPDHDAAVEAVESRRGLTQETTLRFMQGYLFANPPSYAPPLEERYRRL